MVWVGLNMSKGGGLPKKKIPMPFLRSFSMMVYIFLSMMALQMIAYPSWFIKESMSSEGPDSSGFNGSRSCLINNTIGYDFALAKLLLRLGSMSLFFILFFPRHMVGGMKWWCS